MRRALRLLALVLVSASLLAGCFKKDEPTDPGTGTTPPTGTTTTPPMGTTSPTTGGNSTPPPPPQTTPVQDAGAIQGPFEKSWTLNVPQVSPKGATVLFNITGAQPGAPATASVHLEFRAPDGTVLKTATAGLGGEAAVAWTFTAADLVQTGDYVLVASSAPPPGGAPLPTGIPSGGVGNYELTAYVEY